MPFQKGNQINAGKKHTLESRKKMSAWQIGRKHTEETKRKISQSGKGRKVSEETRKKKSGANHPMWKGGGVTWMKLQARLRDNDVCQICGLREPEIMQVDHIQPRALYPELAAVLENLMTVCPNCHARKTNREKRAKIFPKVGKNKFGRIPK